MKIGENIPLSGHTTFKIGGNARYFCAVENEAELKEALAYALTKSVPIFVLGGGSNILVGEAGFPGLVIKIQFKGIDVEEISKDEILITAAAGENWDAFVGKMVEKGYAGLENLSAIPGTVGGAPVQNIGAYGVEVKDLIRSVEVFDPKTNTIKVFENEECQFGYRDSIFKHEGKGLIIMRVTFHLKKLFSPKLQYKDVKKFFEENKNEEPSLADVRNAIIDIRSKKFPDLSKFGTAGSFFKNPIVPKELHDKLLQEFPKMQSFPMDENNVKIPAGWLLDVLCGFKGVRKGDAGVFENQALVLVNWGSATAEHIRALAEEMRAKVKEKTGIELEFEVNIL